MTMSNIEGENIYPNVEIDLRKIKHNIEVVLKKCKKQAIEPVAVVKATNGSKEIYKPWLIMVLRLLEIHE